MAEVTRVTETRSLTLGGFLAVVAGRHAEREALVFDDPLLGGETVRWTYADLLREARAVGRAVLATGAGKGARVGIVMANRPEAVASIFGAAMAGAVAVPLSTFSPAPELAWLLEHADVSVVLAQSALGARRFGDDVAAAEAALPWHTTSAVLGEASWKAFLTAGDDVPDARLDAAIAATTPSDLGLVIYSSGTTDRPKGVLHHHRAPTLQFWQQAELFARDTSTRLWCALPIFWTAGLNTALGATLAAGGCWVMQETFDPGDALRLMARERVTEPYTIPHQARALEEHPDWAGTDLSSCTKVFGKSVFTTHPTVRPDPDWNMPVGYGLSETCAFFAAHPATARREEMKRSMGPLLPGNEVRVVDPDSGRVLGPGEEGELTLRGPTLMVQYVKRSREESLDPDGFFPTGDLGSVDEHGHLHFAGRRTEMIKTGMANVSPAELEVQLRACEPVKLARVVGVPDERLDQVVVLCVELKDGATATEAELKAFLRERVAAYKVPKRVLFFADGEIPMTSSETKVRDADLVALVRERLGSAT